MSLPVVPASSIASQPKVVSLPQTQRIVQDLIECVTQLKEEFISSKLPVTDDNQTLQRLCAKLEQLLRFEMKDRFTMMGKKKDYWDYFCDCLASNKGANDGVKYVKAIGEHKTSQGKGRAFIRFALVHQRLADSLQQCIIHPKTGDWYNSGSVWVQPKVPSTIISSLYDLNDIHFDLSPRGYDLDSVWPSFARNTTGFSGAWSIPISRRSSMTSMDTLSITSMDPSEINRLQQQLASAETARSVLAESVGTLEQERQKAEKTVWMTQGELGAMQQQLKQSVAKYEEVQTRYTALEQSHSKLEGNWTRLEEDIRQRSAELDALQERLSLEKASLTDMEASLMTEISNERSKSEFEAQTLQQKLKKAAEVEEKLTDKITSLEESVEHLQVWDAKKEQQILRLEHQASLLEQRNSDLTGELAKSLAVREHDTTSQLESAQKLHDLISKLKDIEAENIRLQALNVDVKHKHETSEKTVELERIKSKELQSSLDELRSLTDDIKSRLEAEGKKNESLSSELQTLSVELQSHVSMSADTGLKLKSAFDQKTEENERTKAELNCLAARLATGEQRGEILSKFVLQLSQLAISFLCTDRLEAPDAKTATESEFADFVNSCRKSAIDRWSTLQGKLEEAETSVSCLTAERNQLLNMVDKIGNLFPDKVEFTSADLTQQMRELVTRVQAHCTELSDLTNDQRFLKEQLQMAQGEHSDKGKQLSHIEGRLLELEKALKESRASESSLQRQAANLQVTLTSVESQKETLQSQLDKAKVDLIMLQEERDTTEKNSRNLEKKVKEVSISLSAMDNSVKEGIAKEDSLKSTVEQLELDLRELRQLLDSKDALVATLQEKLKEGEETVENFLSSMASLETDNASIATEHDSLSKQLSDRSSQLDAATAEKKELEVSKTALVEGIEKISQELEMKECALNEIAAERDILEVTSRLLEEKVKILSCELEKQQQLADTVTADKMELVRTVEGAEGKVEQLSQELGSLRDALQHSRARAASLEEEAKLVVENHHYEVTDLQQQVLFAKQATERSAEELRQVQEELHKAKAKIEELETVHAHDSTELSWLNDRVKNIAEQLIDANKQVTNLTEANQSLLRDKESLGKQLEEISSLLVQKETSFTEKLQNMHSMLGKFRTENEELQKSSSLSQEETTKGLLDKQENQIMAKRVDELEREIEGLSQQNEVLHSQVVETSGILTRKTAEVEEVKAQVMSIQTETERVRSDSASGKSELEDSLQKLQSRFAELQDAMHGVISERDELVIHQQATQEEIAELKADLAASADGYNFLLQSSQKVADEKDSEIEQLKSQLRDAKQSNSSFSAQLEQTISELHSEVQRLEVDLREKELALQEKENSYVMQVESLQQELSALQFQLSAEQLQYEESLRAVGDDRSTATEMSSRLAEQESTIADLEQELSSQQTGFEIERTNQNQQLEQLKTILKGKEMECRHLSEKLQQVNDQLEESSSSAETLKKENYSLRSTLDHDIEEREEEIRILQSDNEQLKKQLIKIVRDKARLWQQSDALAEHKRKSEGKWMDNNIVTKCMGCKADFSLFLRKHHCRLCGHIFCFNCSDNWVDSTSSSHKARACTPCFKDLQSLDVSIARASLLPENSDDESSNVSTSEDNLSQRSSQNSSRLQSSPPVRANSSEISFYEEARDQTGTESESLGEDIYAGAGSNSPDPELAPLTSTPDPTVSESGSNQDAFQVITQEEITKSVAAYDVNTSGPSTLIDVPNMSSSMLLSADDIARGEINTQNETWVKPGRSFAVPISIMTPFTTVKWQFTVQPKVIVE